MKLHQSQGAMMIEYIDMEQGSDGWFNARLNSIGGTAIGKIAPGGKGRQDLLYDFVGELRTGVPAASFKFQHADRGHEFEPAARKYYAKENFIEIKEVGLVRCHKHKHYSPDGLVGENGMIEIKVRTPAVFIRKHFETMDISLRRQVQWGLWVCDREWCDCIDYCPEDVDQGNAPLIRRVYRDEKPINKKIEHVTGKDLNEKADEFIADMYTMVERLKSA
jgi:hypothetical protein